MIVLQGCKERVERLCFSPDGQSVAAPTAQSVQVWDNISTGTERPRILPYPSIYSLQFLLDANVLLLEGPRVVFHDLATGHAKELHFPPPYESVGHVSFTAEGKHFITAQSSHLGEPPGRLTYRAVADLETTLWSVAATRHFHSPAIFLPDSRRFVVIEWWNGENGFEYGPAFVTRDAQTGNPLQEVRGDGRGHSHPCYFAVSSPDRRHIVGRIGRWIGIYHAEDFTVDPVLICNDTQKDFTGIAFHPSGRYLAATSNDETVKLYDTTTWEVAKTFTWNIGRMRSVAFSPDGTLAAAGSDKGKVVVWDVDL